MYKISILSLMLLVASPAQGMGSKPDPKELGGVDQSMLDAVDDMNAAVKKGAMVCSIADKGSYTPASMESEIRLRDIKEAWFALLSEQQIDESINQAVRHVKYELYCPR